MCLQKIIPGNPIHMQDGVGLPLTSDGKAKKNKKNNSCEQSSNYEPYILLSLRNKFQIASHKIANTVKKKKKF